MTPNRLLRDSLFAMAVAALGAAGCAREPAPAAATPSANSSGSEAALAPNASNATAEAAPPEGAHPGIDLPTARTVPAASSAGHSGGIACGAGECS